MSTKWKLRTVFTILVAASVTLFLAGSLGWWSVAASVFALLYLGFVWWATGIAERDGII